MGPPLVFCLPNSVSAEEKKNSIEIWLHHLKVSRILFFFFTLLMPRSLTQSSMKSSTKSSCSSLRSAVSTSSLSKAVRSGAKAIERGVKRIKKGASAIARPLKRAKHMLSNVSSPIASDEDGSPTASVNIQELPEVININSDGEELDDLKKELGAHSFLSLLIILLIPILRGSKENLEVSGIFFLQA